MISKNLRNEINSVAGDIFNHYYSPPIDEKADEILKIKDEQYFLNFINHFNDFAGNILKFIAGENDFEFIWLYSA